MMGWLYALSAAGYFVLVAGLLYLTDPFRSVWANKPPDYAEMLSIFCVPLVVSVCSAAFLLRSRALSLRTYWFILAVSVAACAVVVLQGYGLFVLPLVPPTLLLAFRGYRAGA
jgi:hypothetical protein